MKKKLNNLVILVTFEQFEYFYYKLSNFPNFQEAIRIFDSRRMYFADRGYQSFWFKGLPVVSKRLKRYSYLDLKDVGNNLNKFRKKTIELLSK